jgi:hypothetical protein
LTLSRRTLIGLIAGASVIPSLVSAVETNNISERLDDAVRSGLVPNVHVVLASRAGHIVLERYFSGADESWGTPLGSVTFGPDTLHDLRSVTKSIVGLLYGIALDRGLVPSPDAPLLAQFPEYPDLAADPQRAHLTVMNALNMTLGMEWDEQRPYTDPKNSEIAMERAPDRYRFVLDRPFVAAPGERWIYSGSRSARPTNRQRLWDDAARLRAAGAVRATRHRGVRMGQGWRRRPVRGVRPAPPSARPPAHWRNGAGGR